MNLTKGPEELIALGIFSANLTERFCQNDAVQLTFKVTLQIKLFIKMREVISIHVGQAGCQMGKLEIFRLINYGLLRDIWERFINLTIQATHAGSCTVWNMVFVWTGPWKLDQLNQRAMIHSRLFSLKLVQVNTFHGQFSWIWSQGKNTGLKLLYFT